MSPKLNNLIENKKQSYLTPKTNKTTVRASESKKIFTNQEESKDNTITKNRNENVVKEINISITPKHIKNHDPLISSRHNVGNLSICFSSPSHHPSIRTTNKTSTNPFKAQALKSPSTNVKFESMIGG